MNSNIDEYLNTASSLPAAELEAYLGSLPETTSNELRRVLKADSIVRSQNLLEPVAPDPLSAIRDRQCIELESLRDYRLERQIGTGGMGDVFLATHTRLRRPVAIKILSGSHFSSEGNLTRFEREMEAIGQLQHPNIVQALDAGSENEKHYLALEFVDGMDAKQLANAVSPLPVAEVCEIARQTALGLAYVHQKGLVHRDIKPSNLLISKDGTVKVADLGLALLPRNENELTHSGAFMGTPDFVAPEQIENSKSVDARTDLYALGCTIYCLLAGHAPFATDEHQTLLNKINAHTNIPPAPLRACRHEIPVELEEAVMQLLEKAPADRIQTASEVAELLSPYSAGADLATLVDANQPSMPAHGTATETLLNKPASTAPECRTGKSKSDAELAVPGSHRTRTRWIVLIACGCLLVAMASKWEQIFRVVSGRGVLVLENSSEDFEITVFQGDEKRPVRLIDKTQGREYELSIGEDYKVRVTEPESGTDFLSDRFSITRNGRTVVKVEAQEHAVAVDRMQETGPNIAFGKRAYFTATIGNLKPQLAVDGNNAGTVRDGDVAFWPVTTESPWFEVDLGGFYDITKIEVFGPTDKAYEEKLDRISIIVKKTALGRGQYFGKDAHEIRFSDEGTHIARTVSKGSHIGRFVRIKRSAITGGFAIAEVRVIGEPCQPEKASIVEEVNRSSRWHIKSPFSSYHISKVGELGQMGSIPQDEWYLEPTQTENGFHLKEKFSHEYLHLGEDDTIRVAELDEPGPSATWIFENIYGNRFLIKNKKSSGYLYVNYKGNEGRVLKIGELSDREADYCRWILRELY